MIAPDRGLSNDRNSASRRATGARVRLASSLRDQADGNRCRPREPSGRERSWRRSLFSLAPPGARRTRGDLQACCSCPAPRAASPSAGAAVSALREWLGIERRDRCRREPGRPQRLRRGGLERRDRRLRSRRRDRVDWSRRRERRAASAKTAAAAPVRTGWVLDGPERIAVSADGRNVYVASNLSGAVAVFDRDTATGALTQKAGLAACISEMGSGGDCVDGFSLLLRRRRGRQRRRPERLRRRRSERRHRDLRPRPRHRRAHAEGGTRRLSRRPRGLRRRSRRPSAARTGDEP